MLIPVVKLTGRKWDTQGYKHSFKLQWLLGLRKFMIEWLLLIFVLMEILCQFSPHVNT